VSTRVIGIGQRTAGDDAVGLAVVDALAAAALPDDVVLLQLADPSALVAELVGRVILVDAMLAPQAPGSVRVVSEADFAPLAKSGVSSHGIGVAQALAVARALGREAEVVVVAVGIRAPTPFHMGLSPEVAAAVPDAVRTVRCLLASGLGEA
jgi:hydrogenase maturation protease